MLADHSEFPVACPCGATRDTLFLAANAAAGDVSRALARRRPELARLCSRCRSVPSQETSRGPA